MHQNKKIIKLKGLLFTSIVILMLISLIVPGITGYWSRVSDYNKAYTYISHYSSLTSACSYGALILFYLLLLICILSYQKKEILVAVISIFSFLIWCMISVYEASLKEIFFGDISVNLTLIPLLYLLGYDKDVVESAKKIIPLIIVSMIVLIIWQSLSFILQYGISTETRSSPSKGMFSVAISACWCYAIGLSKSDGKDHKSLKYIIGVCLLLCAFMILSRSWVIQCILLLYTMIALSSRNKGLFMKIASLISVLLVFTLMINLLPNITGALFNRAGEDTRSGQYFLFFSQVNITHLIWGEGINASYSFLGNSNYKYFDNQYIYVMFHYGVIPIIFMLGVIGNLFKKIKKIDLNEDEKAIIIGSRFISIFFLAALAGLSIYYKLGWNVNTILVFVFIGRAHKLIKEKRNIFLKDNIQRYNHVTK